jgi:hypothetical protein
MSIASDISFGIYNAQTVTATGNVSAANVASSGSLTFAGTITGGSIALLFEKANLIASSPPVVTDIDLLTSTIQYWTSNATSNFAANIRGNATTPLNTILGVGQSSTVVLIIPQATAYFANVVRIDNSVVTPVWQGGTTVTAGNANSIDLYTFTIIKTANAIFRVFASQTRYQHTG